MFNAAQKSGRIQIVSTLFAHPGLGIGRTALSPDDRRLCTKRTFYRLEPSGRRYRLRETCIVKTPAAGENSSCGLSVVSLRFPILSYMFELSPSDDGIVVLAGHINGPAGDLVVRILDPVQIKFTALCNTLMV